jgi:hypothetical protein
MWKQICNRAGAVIIGLDVTSKEIFETMIRSHEISLLVSLTVLHESFSNILGKQRRYDSTGLCGVSQDKTLAAFDQTVIAEENKGCKQKNLSKRIQERNREKLG